MTGESADDVGDVDYFRCTHSMRCGERTKSVNVVLAVRWLVRKNDGRCIDDGATLLMTHTPPSAIRPASNTLGSV